MCLNDDGTLYYSQFYIHSDLEDFLVVDAIYQSVFLLTRKLFILFHDCFLRGLPQFSCFKADLKSIELIGMNEIIIIIKSYFLEREKRIPRPGN